MKGPQYVYESRDRGEVNLSSFGWSLMPMADLWATIEAYLVTQRNNEGIGCGSISP